MSCTLHCPSAAGLSSTPSVYALAVLVLPASQSSSASKVSGSQTPTSPPSTRQRYRLHGFSEDCIYPLLETPYDEATSSFSNLPGVTTSISDFGGQFCAPIPYEPLFVAAQAVGYTFGKAFPPVFVKILWKS